MGEDARSGTFACRACDSGECSPFYQDLGDRFCGVAGRFDYVRCARCGLLQIAQVPTNLDEFYARYRLHSPDSLFYSLMRRALIGHCYFMPSSAGGALLDVGCGNGWYLKAMQRKGWRPFGFEFSPAYARELAAALGLPVFATKEQLAEHAGSFDLVTFNFSLEHLEHPQEFLRLAWECLRPGGRVYLSVPNIEGKEARLFGRCWFHLDPPRHVTLYTKKLLAGLLQRIGFADIQIANLAAPTGFAGSICYRLCEKFRPLVWYLGLLPGSLFSLFIRDGNFGITGTKA